MAAAVNDQLQSFLNDIYNTPQNTPAPPFKSQKKPMPHAPGTDLELFASDDFRMFCYKVVPCSIRGPHEWTTCGFCHPGEKAMRRCPQKYQYAAIACPDVKAGECPRGETCCFAHTVFEYWLHPSRYRTQMCSYGSNCKRPICFFAHNNSEVREPENLAQLLAIERELEGDSGFGFSGGSRWASLPNAKSSPTQQHQQQLQQQRSLDPSQLYHVQGGQTPFLNSVNSMNGLNMPAGLPPRPPTGPPPPPPPLNIASSLPAPLQSLTSEDIDAQMAAAMKLLAELSVTKQQLQQQQLQQQQQQQPNPYSSMNGWQAAAAAALQPSSGSMSQPGLPNSLGYQFSGPNPFVESAPAMGTGSLHTPMASADLQSALMSVLPGLLKQLGGVGAPPMTPPRSVSSMPLNSAALASLGLPMSKGDMMTPITSSPLDVLSMRSTSISKSTGTVSPRSSEGSRSPVPSSRGDDSEDTLGCASLGLTPCPGMGLGMEFGLESIQEQAEAYGCFSHEEHGLEEMLLANSSLIESLSQLVDEPTAWEMNPSVQELDQELTKLSSSSTASADA